MSAIQVKYLCAAQTNCALWEQGTRFKQAILQKELFDYFELL